MTEFKHSIVLFSGEDGLPLEFNIVNAFEKIILKAMIEHGGGMCTLNDSAINLISPGTKVFNADFHKRFVSSNYIFDCVEKNYLLNMSDYEIKITELETSDISDDSGNIMKNMGKSRNGKNVIGVLETDSNGESFEKSNNKIVCSNACSEDFQPAKLALFSSTPSLITTEQYPKKVMEMEQIVEEPPLLESIEEYSSSFKNSENEWNISVQNTSKKTSVSIENPSSPDHIIEEYSSCQSDIVKSASQLKENIHERLTVSTENELNENLLKEDISDKTVSDLQIEAMQVDNVQGKEISIAIEQPLENNHEITVEAVSSSQPQNDCLDELDYAVLKKSKIVNEENEENSLSQSYTVSSSADAQIASKPDSSAEIFDGILDPELNQQKNQSTTNILYIQELEKEIEQILSRPSPKSIQDKICLVKYICCVKRLPPAEVLQLLQNI